MSPSIISLMGLYDHLSIFLFLFHSPIFNDVSQYFIPTLITLYVSIVFLFFSILDIHFLFLWNRFKIIIFLYCDSFYSLSFFINPLLFIESNFLCIFNFFVAQSAFHFPLFPAFFICSSPIITSTFSHSIYCMRFIFIISKQIIYCLYQHSIPIKF
jgi:hypothetical protein